MVQKNSLPNLFFNASPNLDAKIIIGLLKFNPFQNRISIYTAINRNSNSSHK